MKAGSGGLVVDCSVAVAWCFEDETSPETDAVLERVRDEGALVPALWHLELGNVLVQAERRNRLTAADTATRLDLIAALPILTDGETPERGLREVVTLARAEGLTTYDAAYLELAMRKGLPLASKDRALAAAADRAGIANLIAV
jgi:predicted nucleic acid-binding protein